MTGIYSFQVKADLKGPLFDSGLLFLTKTVVKCTKIIKSECIYIYIQFKE